MSQDLASKWLQHNFFFKSNYWQRRLHHYSVTCTFRLICKLLTGEWLQHDRRSLNNTQTQISFPERCSILNVLSLSHTSSTGHLTPRTTAAAQRTQREETTSQTPKHPVMDYAHFSPATAADRLITTSSLCQTGQKERSSRLRLVYLETKRPTIPCSSSGPDRGTR